jgi:hypothetical protein
VENEAGYNSNPMPEEQLLTTSLTQEYVITDPQGNARVSFQNNSGVAKVTQENSYYGYGLQMFWATMEHRFL